MGDQCLHPVLTFGGCIYILHVCTIVKSGSAIDHKNKLKEDLLVALFSFVSAPLSVIRSPGGTYIPRLFCFPAIIQETHTGSSDK